MKTKRPMREIKFKNKKFVQDENQLYTFYGMANDLMSYALIQNGEVFRFNEVIGKEKDIVFSRSFKKMELDKYRLKTKDAEFKDLVGEKIVAFYEDETPSGFWGDRNERYIIKTKSGKAFIMETGGGTNVMGFPGSQQHGVWISKVLNPELLDL